MAPQILEVRWSLDLWVPFDTQTRRVDLTKKTIIVFPPFCTIVPLTLLTSMRGYILEVNLWKRRATKQGSIDFEIGDLHTCYILLIGLEESSMKRLPAFLLIWWQAENGRKLSRRMYFHALIIGLFWFA